MKYVYFIKPVGMDGPIKIGCSDTPKHRLMSFSIWSPFPLEIIGFVPGTFKDEGFLHQCFADLHTHQEWFHSSPGLRLAIASILKAGSVTCVRETLKPKGVIRFNKSKDISLERKQYLSISAKVRNAARRLSNRHGTYYPPADINKIISRWCGSSYRQIVGIPPTATEMDRIGELLADPKAHCEFHAFKPRLVEAAVPHIVEDVA